MRLIIYYFLVYFQFSRYPSTNFGFAKALLFLLVPVACGRELMRFARQRQALFAHAHWALN